MMTLNEWLDRWQVPAAAREELAREVLGHECATVATNKRGVPGSEAYVQSAIRLEAAYAEKRAGVRVMLFRNNVGALQDDEGRPVRYGLANESKAENEVLKSSDLIGWERVIVTPAMVGKPVARFLAVECKEAGWTYKGDSHEQAQQRWLDLVNADGGHARFASAPGIWTPVLPPLPKL